MRKTRAVVIGTPMFPLLMGYSAELVNKVWGEEVDAIYLAVSNPEHLSAYSGIKEYLMRNPRVHVIETARKWPESVNMVAKIVKEDTIMFAHDDTLIFKKGVVDAYFRRVEETGVVVTTSQPIYAPIHLVDELIKQKYPDAQYLDHCFSFYCNFFFVPRELFAKTRGDFGAWEVKVGEYSPDLNYMPRLHPMNADTNFLIALDLIAAGAKFEIVDKHDALSIIHYPDPIEKLMELGDAGWLHVQSLSYHVHGYYFDVGERERLEEMTGGKVARKIHNQPIPEDPVGRRAWEFKIAWIYYFLWECPFDYIKEYRDHSKTELEYMIGYFGLDPRNIKRLASAIKQIIGGLDDKTTT